MPASQNVTGLDGLVRDLELITDEVIDKGERIVGQGMNNIRGDARKRLRASRFAHLPHLPKSFDYDVTWAGYVITGEAGANRDKLQGRLDPFIEYGTTTSAPHPHWAPALEAEVPKFEKYVGLLVEEAFG